ncbi:DMT family transporter [Lentibacter algarum]|uniref:DMT family transporter n=1 Tax=Lentibacter algarum TaxID=576131 RepID=UPI001C06B4FE|nr:DMT family transporter [Lentibacter algarum]MBU2981290.1 DMT family transporter [Lentibacter algarum]
MRNADTLRLVFTVFVAVTFVVFGDTAGKLLTSGGVDPFIVAWSRFGLAAIFLLPFSGLSRAELKQFADWRVLLRGACITCGIVSILTALKTEPIANVFGAFFVGPVVAYVLAIVFLGEKPSPLRTALLGLGFFGVMLIVKPGFGGTFGIVFALIAGVFYGCFLVMTRALAGAYRPRFLLISQLLIGSVLLTPFGLSAEVPAFGLNICLLIAVSVLGSAVGNFLLVLASKTAEASLIAPLVYSQLISATVVGVLVFGDWPDAYSLFGLILIAASGAGSLAVNHFATRASVS